MNATTNRRLPAFKKVHSGSAVKRFRSIHPKNGDVYDITKPAKQDEFACLSVNGQGVSWTRDKAELVKRAQQLAAEG
jgi:hypothetical protein